MNLLHRWACRSTGWGKVVERHIVPWTLEGVELGGDALEIGPGPGLTTNVLRTQLPKLTCIEIDRRLADSLQKRMAGTSPSTAPGGVTVVQGDATEMSFPDGTFTGAVCFTMLHHVPSQKLQDRLLAETFRVLEAGAWFAGTDSRTSLRWRLYHLFDMCVPVDPDTFASRLEEAGFVDATVDSNPWAFRFRARRP
ncbi:MAG TPA: class I SAM-dependent methyltransferase [Dehalococcoidia bacterium]|nr:class I SAM-dependent methyltransferase [Dehalococcoidia bacterium]